MIRGVTADDAHRTPVDQALDLFVYLPVGFVFELPRSIPRFIERGRRELHANGRLTGGDDDGGLDLANPIDRVQAHAMGTLRALGVLPREDTPPAPGGDDGPVVKPVARPTVVATPVPDPAPAVAEAPREPGGDVDALAIPAYDSLSASQVMPRLESLADDELELVRRYEHANRGRKTILNKIAQLQAG
jgi:hypothetical protein